MQKVTIYHNPRCSKSRQSLAILQDKGIEAKVTEYLKDTPSRQELEAIIDKLGISACELIRKGEAEFKENFKGKELSEADCIKAMVEFPKLIERPIIVTGNKAVIGRPPERVLEIL